MGVRKQGLTLLEVLAAFLIFSMVFTVLVGSSQTAVRSQGLSVRRLEAHEIAEMALADLEIAMARHELPSIEEQDETERDDFVIRVRESTLISEEDLSPSSMDSDGSDILSQMAAQLPEVGKYLMRYEVEVEWTEASSAQKITRTTFAFDWEEAQAENPDLFAAGGLDGDASSGESGTDDEDSSEDGDSPTDEDRRRSSSEREGSSENRDGGDAKQKLIEELKKQLKKYMEGRNGQ